MKKNITFAVRMLVIGILFVFVLLGLGVDVTDLARQLGLLVVGLLYLAIMGIFSNLLGKLAGKVLTFSREWEGNTYMVISFVFIGFVMAYLNSLLFSIAFGDDVYYLIVNFLSVGLFFVGLIASMFGFSDSAKWPSEARSNKNKEIEEK